jgi:homoserine dehydrogenase
MSHQKIGLLGCGVVGQGVVDMLRGTSSTIAKIAVKDMDKPRDIHINPELLTTDPMSIVEDPDIPIIIELIGGADGLAKHLIVKALQLGKTVITGNKACISKHLKAIEDLGSGRLWYEAAVCGGIPLIHDFKYHIKLDTLTSIEGIMNGTTNYMLSQMESQGVEFLDTLHQAQVQGYAEADPSSDIDGLDAVSKLVILIRLGFGQQVDPARIYRVSMRNIQLCDIAAANVRGMSVRYVASARIDVSGELVIFVAPCFVSHNSNFARIYGCANYVQTQSKRLGLTSWSGSGAGRYPTAISVVADLSRVHNVESSFGPLQPPLTLANDLVMDFYCRASCTQFEARLRDEGISFQRLETQDNSLCYFLSNTSYLKLRELGGTNLVIYPRI